jgi:glyoxylase-like metal-dependent hydrolase (beta-lactamase superfamily II)
MTDYHPASTGAMPPGSKLWLLDLGGLNVDDSVIVSGRNTSTPKSTTVEHKRRDLVMICIMIYYPGVGLILYDTGSPEDVIANWNLGDLECTPRIWDKATNGLPEAIKATGNDIKDVKIVIMSHLHMDHAGGLEHFMGTGKF